ncbi:hypothetical protein [Schinkia azotoformans]|uniref:hypothetical protein n=1 Tax=Schinkia azotoformans TaxID=1454 RepID=UPI002DB7999E|nr:hypothetical protein [Schinkia azotoformans]MEC1788623.1 hypothetical protein [Schinkia azotoformans]MED4419942.1 hypothetical protein [Schinkia azotoformans]
MRERFLRKYKQEVNDSSVVFFDFCKEKVCQQFEQKGCDDPATQLLAVLILNSNGIFRGISN